MSGHSKWPTIKRSKGAADVKRGKIFSKIAKEIEIAARLGGGDPGGNPRLRDAIAKARAVNMPKDNITRAVKKGSGELGGGVSYEEILYEGYGPGGVAVLVEAMTDNRNRTVSEVRQMFSKNGGNMGEAGCVNWMLEKKGVILVSKAAVSEDVLMELALEAGADDVAEEGDCFRVLTSPASYMAVQDALAAKSLTLVEASLSMEAKTLTKLTGEDAKRALLFLETLEDHDDVQKVHSNLDVDEDELARLMG